MARATAEAQSSQLGKIEMVSFAKTVQKYARDSEIFQKREIGSRENLADGKNRGVVFYEG